MFVPESCIGFHLKWLSGATADEDVADLDVEEMAKSVISIHHEHHVRNEDDPDGLMVLQMILDKIARYLDVGGWKVMRHELRQQRQVQVDRAKRLVQQGKIDLLDAVCILFTKEELLTYGL